MTDTTPVIILAFANDPDDYLKNIRRERQNLFAALRPQADRRAVNVYKEEETSTEALFKLFSDYADRVAIFHYGGHANGTALRLESVGGAAETAHAAGLAQLLGLQKGLQLVFLNGCATRGQVKLLLASGVRAVIATAVPIDDQMATEFAEQFYESLANKATIGRAFENACAFIKARYGDRKAVGAFRSFDAVADETVAAELAWGLYVNANAEAALDWALPDAPGNSIIIRGAPPAADGRIAVNTALIASTLAALAPFSQDIRDYLAREEVDRDERDYPDMIMNAYPLAIGVQLQKLFAHPATADLARLRQLVVTYEVIARLFCFVMISQLWNARLRNRDLVIADDQWAVLNGFLSLTADSQPVFDYFRLATAVVDILAANGVAQFVPEFAGMTAELTDAPTQAARRFMDEMRAELHQGTVPGAEVESFCDQAEGHLATLLADFAFVVKYPFSTVRKIEFRKARNKDPRFVMETARLDKPNAGFKTRPLEALSSTESESVILQISRDNAIDYLNLTPFVIDESALNSAQSARLFLYDFRDAAGNFHYVSIDNGNDRIIVDDRKYPDIKAQAREFFEAVFAP